MQNIRMYKKSFIAKTCICIFFFHTLSVILCKNQNIDNMEYIKVIFFKPVVLFCALPCLPVIRKKKSFKKNNRELVRSKNVQCKQSCWLWKDRKAKKVYWRQDIKQSKSWNERGGPTTDYEFWNNVQR